MQIFWYPKCTSNCKNNVNAIWGFITSLVIVVCKTMFYLIHLELKIIEGLFLISENNYVQLAVSWYYICSLAFSPCLLKTAIDGHVTSILIEKRQTSQFLQISLLKPEPKNLHSMYRYYSFLEYMYINEKFDARWPNDQDLQCIWFYI